MYGNNQRVHVVQVDVWTKEGAGDEPECVEVVVHRMSWQRERNGEFSLFSDFENRYNVHPTTNSLWRFFDVVQQRFKPCPVYLNGKLSTWPDVEEAVYELGRRGQNREAGGACLLSTKFVEG